ncbi:hypothetical protein A2755_01355 [Candidatus Wolfebacteria bacterium RIFCSPHIGHO2_01_FULL_48_22]|uniref:Carbohydrate kinase PfkB domain-containing protein n=2 Tax=Candidatus Wolfeibacteriota TaxID=1752735 RepID=A0A1F8DXA8_9BACT|nr:MAG: hypothetical protein A2755_01355 [Candidatus Wolfebacteria bacterium RIFCSPHIGHO2_01_FULL_48_22]OGM93902.1 MAG: hypothetical protein A2935_03430 [Candidatus Wolfebacteria bacterium RIFCSPLOWO2_01_FULL_47_17b]
MLDVVSIGSSTLDIFIPVPFRNRLPVGSKLKIDAVTICGGGGAHNSAVTFKRNGLKVQLVTRVGDDVFGKKIQQIIHAQKIKASIRTDSSGSSGVSYILLDAKGDQTILTQRGVSGIFSKDEFSKMPESKWAYISTGAMPLHVLSALVKILHDRGTRIAINPSSEMLAHGLAKIRPILNRSRVVLLNRKEAASLTGVSIRRKRKIFKKLDADVLGIAIMTDGERGAFVSDGKTILKSDAVRVRKVVDMTGAGDAFGSAFVAALIKKGENCEKGTCRPDHLQYALEKGTEHAAKTIQHIGAV